MSDYTIMSYRGTDVPLDSRDSDKRMVNVTELFKASGAPHHKRPAEWYRQEQTQELVAELLKWSETTSIDTASQSHIFETRKSGTEGQRGGGSTWYCEDLALAYAMYLSPALHVACLRFIRQHWHGGSETAIAQRDLGMVETAMSDMQKQLSDMQKQLNKSDLRQSIMLCDQEKDRAMMREMHDVIKDTESIVTTKRYTGCFYIAKFDHDQLADAREFMADKMPRFNEFIDQGYELVNIGKHNEILPDNRIRQHTGKLAWLASMSVLIGSFMTDNHSAVELHFRKNYPSFQGVVKVSGFRDWFFVPSGLCEKIVCTWPEGATYKEVINRVIEWEFDRETPIEDMMRGFVK